MHDGVMDRMGMNTSRVSDAVCAMMPLQVSGLSLKMRETTLIDSVTFGLGPTGITMIMGPNGAGKSLLLRLLHGLQVPTAGTIAWNDTPASPAMTRRQALVFQQPVLLRRSVAANVGFILKARDLPLGDLDRLLADVGLLDKKHLPARRLSGGEQQRLSLARALATRPEVLFLDEPTASLDPASTQVIEEIVRVAAAGGTRVIFVTHDIAQARRMADDVIFLHRGRVTEHSPAPRFFADPVSEPARAYLAGHLVT